MITVSLDGLHAYVERWHDTWDVVGAAFTALAVIVSLFFGMQQYRRVQRELQDTRKEKQRLELRAARREREQQVRRVVVYPTALMASTRPGNNHDVLHFDSAGDPVQLEVFNHADMPIFDVKAAAIRGDRRHVHIHGGSLSRPLLPGASALVEASAMPSARPEDGALGWRHAVLVRDGHGQRWIRDVVGGVTPFMMPGESHAFDDDDLDAVSPDEGNSSPALERRFRPIRRR